MCGIAGVIDFSGAVPEQDGVRRMALALRHRGPDAEGFAGGPYFQLGHRRLKIIDLSDGANQPMRDASGAVIITFNGEVYNYEELRRELEHAGVRFRTRSDTEVLLEGYVAWGIDALLRRARGMWAFALWDGKRHVLHLARDRFGKKPLVYVKAGRRVVFASSLNALRESVDLRTLDFGAIASFLSLNYIPPDECAFEGVEKVPAGSVVEIDESGARTKRYWQLEHRDAVSISEGDATREAERLLNASISDRLVADVDVGSFLSGGLDSGLVTTLMAAQAPSPQTFTMRVEGWRDESQRARIVAELARTRHEEVPASEADLAIVPWLLTQYGEPFGDSSMIPTALVARSAARRVKVVMTGDGGDEVFGGYGEPALLRTLLGHRRRLPFSLVPFAAALGATAVEHRPERLIGYGMHWRRYFHAISGGLDGYAAALGRVDPCIAKRALGPTLRQSWGASNAPLRFVQKAPEGPEWKRLLWAKDQLQLQGDFLVKVDIATMAYGLEARLPFLDHRLAEFTFNLPWELWQLDGVVKGLLRRVAQQHLPERYLAFPKHGFSIPCEDYLFGAWEPLLRNLLAKGVSEELGLIDVAGVFSLLDGFRSLGHRRMNVAKFLYNLFCLEIWLRSSYLRSESVESLSSRFQSSLTSRKPTTLSAAYE